MFVGSSQRPGLPPEGICAGKQSVAEYLAEKHSFIALRILPSGSKSETHDSVSAERKVESYHVSGNLERSFADVESLLEFVTERWRERWVTTDIWDEKALKSLLRRPSFLLISVDAPISLRWERFKQRSVER